MIPSNLFVRSLAPLAALALLTGCGSVESLMPHSEPDTLLLNQGVNPRPVAKSTANPSEKVKVLPVSSADILCPQVDVAENGAALRVGGADNSSVRYQFNVGDIARECDPAGPGQATIKVGVAGHVVIGPAGAPGTFSAPLKVTVTDIRTKQDVFSKTFAVQSATDGVTAGTFQIVTDPIPVSMPTLQLVDVYSITVGFAGAGAGAEPRARRHKTTG